MWTEKKRYKFFSVSCFIFAEVIFAQFFNGFEKVILVTANGI